MLEIEFYDREKEIGEIRRILSTRPNLIMFVYRPINSGKSSLMLEVIRKLPKNLHDIYIDLREIRYRLIFYKGLI